MPGSHLCIPINETVQPLYFQNSIIMFCLPIPTLIYLWEIYIFPGSVCLFCCRQKCGLILGIYKSLTDTWMRKLGLRPRNSQKKEYINGIFIAVWFFFHRAWQGFGWNIWPQGSEIDSYRTSNNVLLLIRYRKIDTFHSILKLWHGHHWILFICL